MRSESSRGRSSAEESTNGSEERSTSAPRADTTKIGNKPVSIVVQLRRHGRRWLLVLVGVAVFALEVAQFAHATSAALGAAQESEAECSLATLNGAFIMQAQGIAVGGSVPGPFGYASISTYDGKGNTHATYSGSWNGMIRRNQTLTGTYTVDADCTGTKTVELGGGAVSHYDMFLSPNGNMYSLVQTDAGVIVTAIFYRVPLRSSDN
jgi:hypothetical protein